MIENFNLAVSYMQEQVAKVACDFLEFEQKALEERIPIISREIQHLLRFFVKLHRPKTVLEIGTAVGFSGTLIASELVSWSGKLTTVEIDEQRYYQAKKNFEYYKVDHCVDAILCDAMNYLEESSEKFDFIFIDAAKSSYERYFTLALKLLNDKGVIFIDNLMFKGSVYEDMKKYRTIGNHLNQFISNTMSKEFLLLPIGDGIGIYYKE